MKFYKATETGFEQVSEQEFYRETICGADNFIHKNEPGCVCLIFHKDGQELGRQFADVEELKTTFKK